METEHWLAPALFSPARHHEGFLVGLMIYDRRCFLGLARRPGERSRYHDLCGHDGCKLVYSISILSLKPFPVLI